MTASRSLCLLSLLLVAVGCSEKPDPNRLKTFPVKGVVLVDGKPVEFLAVTCHNEKGLDPKNPTMSQALTDKDGKFQIGTYASGDGVPEGDYVLTYMWGDWQPFSMTYGGPDKLHDRYNSLKKSPTKFKVEKGKPIDLGKIELTTK
jgi:hypothetical protein